MQHAAQPSPVPSQHRPLPGGAPRLRAAEHYEALLLENLPFIERTVASIARRNALKPWDADDFEGLVKLRLVADDFAVLRKFEGRAKLTTFLTTVIQNLFRDFRIQRWGKWRPSAAAKRIGEIGIQLETLLYRDGFASNEAFQILRDRYDVLASDTELDAIAAQVRPRTNRRFEDDSLLEKLAAPERADQNVLDRERRFRTLRAVKALREAVAHLAPEDRLILRLRFCDSLTIRAIADTLELPRRRMYTRLRKLLGDVRVGIENQGVDCEEVLDLLDRCA